MAPYRGTDPVVRGRPFRLRRAPQVRRELPDGLLDFDAEGGGLVLVVRLQVGEESASDVTGEQFGGGILDGQA